MNDVDIERVRIVVVSAGLRQPSSTRLLADRLAEATGLELRAREREVEVRTIELRDLATDIAHNLVTGFPSSTLAEVLGAVTKADALIAVSPIFSASYSGLFKSFFDLLENTDLAGKPVLIAATGGSVRHSLALEHALRPLFVYLRAVVMPTAVFAATEDWGSATRGAADLKGRVERAAEELAEFVSGRPSSSRASTPRDEEVVVPFEELLAL